MLDGQVIFGASLSKTVTVKEQLAVLPLPSVARYETVVIPTGNTDPLAVLLGDERLRVALQLSLNEGREYATARPHTPSVEPRLSEEGHVIRGASLSTTVTFIEHVARLPEKSATEYVDVVRPSEKLPPGDPPAATV